MSSGALEAAMNAFGARALAAIQALQREQGRAEILVGHAKDPIQTLEIAISRTEEPQFDEKPSTLTHLSGLFDLGYQIFLPMLRREHMDIDVSCDHAHVLERLCESPGPAALTPKLFDMKARGHPSRGDYVVFFDPDENLYSDLSGPNIGDWIEVKTLFEGWSRETRKPSKYCETRWT